MNNRTTKFTNTAALMQQALFKLLDKKEFNEIGIAEICKVAGVNRSTFYDHYQNTADLLQEAVNGSIADFTKQFGNLDITHSKAINEDSNILASEKYLVPYLEYVKQNKIMFRAYNNNPHTFSSNTYDDILIKNIFTPIYKKNGVYDDTVIMYMSKYFLAGVNKIISEWVNRDCKDDILFIVEMITFCVRPKN